jgi:hypothetical protein
VKGKWVTICAANPFCMIKSILLKTTSIDLRETTLLCMSFWTLCKRSTLSGARNSKVSNVKWYKSTLIVRIHFLMFGRFVWSSFKGRLSRNKIPRRQSPLVEKTLFKSVPEGFLNRFFIRFSNSRFSKFYLLNRFLIRFKMFI